jgi:glyoxylase-like metal-dependent hydrolase (beta-lactamase superfamily II)
MLANVGPGHTAHDLALLVPGGADCPPVLFCGDLVEESGEPQAGPDAVPARWPAALDRLLDLGGEDAVYVPGHGDAVNAAFVRAQRDTLAMRFGVS